MKKVENTFFLNFSYKLDEDSKDVAVMVAGYIAKKFSGRSKCSKCQLKIVTTESKIGYDDNLHQLSRGDLTTQSISLCDFIL